MDQKINASDVEVSVALALKNLLDKFFKQGELIRFSMKPDWEKMNQEAILSGNFLASFPAKGLMDFGCKVYMVRHNDFWTVSHFMEISHPDFREGKPVDLKLPTSVERGFEFKKELGF